MTAQPKVLNPATEPVRSPARSAGGARYPTTGFDWRRFWIRALLAALAFNVLALLLTVYVIFPWLHPGH